ncbi:glycosyltransferase [bacterium]|nr:glycosyltransferase [bacterium]
MFEDLKVAIVHEYLHLFGGAERVLYYLLQAFPKADVYTLTYRPEKLPPFLAEELKKHRLIVSPLNKVPSEALRRILAPSAVESWYFDRYDLVISNSNSYAKGVITSIHTAHLAYIHTPTRYLWDYTHRYLKEKAKNRLSLAILRKIFLSQRRWDYIAGQRPDMLVANSLNVKKRIKKYYRRKAEVLYPPIETEKFSPSAKKDFFLVVSRLSPYKRVDLVVSVFRELDLPLKIVGEGVELKRLKKLAGSAKNIEFLGFVSEKKLRELYAQALAVIYPQEEDFGLVPLEAQASGTPVIAYKKGGVLETVSKETGILFSPQTESALRKAIQQFLRQKDRFKAEILRQNAEKFGLNRFYRKLQQLVQKVLEKNKN